MQVTSLITQSQHRVHLPGQHPPQAYKYFFSLLITSSPGQNIFNSQLNISPPIKQYLGMYFIHKMINKALSLPLTLALLDLLDQWGVFFNAKFWTRQAQK